MNSRYQSISVCAGEKSIVEGGRGAGDMSLEHKTQVRSCRYLPLSTYTKLGTCPKG